VSLASANFASYLGHGPSFVQNGKPPPRDIGPKLLDAQWAPYGLCLF